MTIGEAFPFHDVRLWGSQSELPDECSLRILGLFSYTSVDSIPCLSLQARRISCSHVSFVDLGSRHSNRYHWFPHRFIKSQLFAKTIPHLRLRTRSIVLICESSWLQYKSLSVVLITCTPPCTQDCPTNDRHAFAST